MAFWLAKCALGWTKLACLIINTAFLAQTRFICIEFDRSETRGSMYFWWGHIHEALVDEVEKSDCLSRRWMTSWQDLIDSIHQCKRGNDRRNSREIWKEICGRETEILTSLSSTLWEYVFYDVSQITDEIPCGKSSSLGTRCYILQGILHIWFRLDTNSLGRMIRKFSWEYIVMI